MLETHAVQVAEDVMFLRWRELGGNSDYAEERGQIRDASDELLKIKIEKLDWPKPFSDLRKGARRTYASAIAPEVGDAVGGPNGGRSVANAGCECRTRCAT